MSPQKNFENKVFKDSRKIDLQHTSEAIRVLRKRGTSPPPFSKNREEFPPPFRSWKREIFYENAFFFMPKKHDFYLKNGHFSTYFGFGFDLFHSAIIELAPLWRVSEIIEPPGALI